MWARLCLSVAVLGSMGGCEQSALMQLSRETNEAEQRVLVKQQHLSGLEVQNRALIEEKNRLLRELETEQVSFSDLDSRLAVLRKENARMAAHTERERQDRAHADAALRKYQHQVSTLTTDNQLSPDAKHKRIDALKKEIKTYLELGLR
ncbi:MAG: hypothetical protein ACREV1_04205 [Gammaproteobacteria bacterium]